MIEPLYLLSFLYYLRSINWKFEVSIYYRFTDFETYFDTGSCIFLHKRHKLTTSSSLKYSSKSIQISLTEKLWKKIINRNHKGLKTVRYNGSWNLKVLLLFRRCTITQEYGEPQIVIPVSIIIFFYLTYMIVLIQCNKEVVLQNVLFDYNKF